MTEPVVVVEEITPQRAATYLMENTKNRSLRKGIVERYSEQMVEGEWYFTGDPIKFDTEGNLIDGQHRLSAICLARVTLPMTVARGVDVKSLIAFDTGLKRSLGDVLTIKGETYASVLATVLYEAVRWERWEFADSTRGSTSHANLITYTDALDLLERRPNVRDAASWVASVSHFNGRGFIRTGPMGQLYAYGSVVDDEFMNIFMDKVVHGIGIEAKDDPAYALRQRFIRVASNANDSLTQTQYRAFLVKAWNAAAEDEAIVKLIYKGGEIPKPYGYELWRNDAKNSTKASRTQAIKKAV